MSDYVMVIIDDQIRDERFTQRLETNREVSVLIMQIVEQYGLPRYSMAGNNLHYDLIRSQTGQALPDNTTLLQASILDGEELQLVSPEARLIWKLIQKLKDEIKDYIKEKLEEKAREKIEELREALKQTKTADPEAEQLAQMTVSSSDGTYKLADDPGDTYTLADDSAPVKKKRRGRGRFLFVSFMIAIVAVIVIVVRSCDIINPPGPDPLVGDCWCDGAALRCDDGTFEPGHPECGGGEQPVDCWCEGTTFVCSDGTSERRSPECAGQESVDCWCEGQNLVCSNDTVERGHPECGGEEELR